VSLVARQLETAGIPTVVAGSALDIAEYCGAPRFAFTDFPLGNPLGKPGDKAMQLAITRFALELLNSAKEPGTTRQTPYHWSDSHDCRALHSSVVYSHRVLLCI